MFLPKSHNAVIIVGHQFSSISLIYISPFGYFVLKSNTWQKTALHKIIKAHMKFPL